MTVEESSIEFLSKDVFESLAHVNYSSLDEAGLSNAVNEGPSNIDFTTFISWLSKELKYFFKLDDYINPVASPDEVSSFMLELSSFLKELGCPYQCLMTGPVNDRLKNNYERYLLLDYLISELQAARMIHVNNPEADSIQLTLKESPTAANLKNMLIALKVPKPPMNITSEMLFSKVQAKVKETSNDLICEPLYQGVLTEKQWGTLGEVLKDLENEYTIRRQLLLKRLDVTIQSFQWSDRTKGKENEIATMFNEKRKCLQAAPSVSISDLLASRQYLAVIEKTSNANVRKHTKSSLNKVIIGKVPDRGGRPNEQQPPPPEMPSWAPRSQDSGRGGRGGGGRGGGRVQGGWNQGGGGGGHQGGGGGYQGGRGGHQGSGGGHQGGGGGYQGGGGGYQGGGGGYQGGGGGYQGGGGGYQGGGGGFQGGGSGYQGGRGGNRKRY